VAVLVNPFIYGGASNLVTTLYTGSGAARDIVTGQNYLSDGGFIWGKPRDTTSFHIAIDTFRGADKRLRPNIQNEETTNANIVTEFLSNGFRLGSDSQLNETGRAGVLWSFAQRLGFMTMVGWIGDGVAGREIDIDLGGADFGVALVKSRDLSASWSVQHRSIDPSKILFLNASIGEQVFGNHWNSTAGTSTKLTLGDNAGVNQLGAIYYAIVFAHNPAQKIFCGTFTTDGSGNATVTIGFAPNWLMPKNAVIDENWIILDTERGWGSGNDAALFPNTNGAEATGTNYGAPTSDGFTFIGTPNSTYPFVAIG
jgi:hypothetical protein